MKERPILFSGPMVNAILEGRKTQTRRVLKSKWFELHDKEGHLRYEEYDPGRYGDDGDGRHHAGSGPFDPVDPRCQRHAASFCPYGNPGDRLWVREAFRHYGNRFSHGKGFGLIEYFADGTHSDMPSDSLPHLESANSYWYKRRPSIHMPRWASRITLEITNVRVERLFELSMSDAHAEGMICPIDGLKCDGPCEAKQGEFRHLWDKINGKTHPWASNPWVWAVEFKKI